jgi:hypothetical protein
MAVLVAAIPIIERSGILIEIAGTRAGDDIASFCASLLADEEGPRPNMPADCSDAPRAGRRLAFDMR